MTTSREYLMQGLRKGKVEAWRAWRSEKESVGDVGVAVRTQIWTMILCSSHTRGILDGKLKKQPGRLNPTHCMFWGGGQERMIRNGGHEAGRIRVDILNAFSCLSSLPPSPMAPKVA